MKREEAEAILNYLAAGMGETLAPNQAAVWLPEIERLDAEKAMKVAMETVRTYPRMPSLAEFRRSVRTEGAAEIEPLPDDPVEEPNEWVRVWSWARMRRDPPELRAMPQQHPHHQPPYLTAAEYAALRQEWIDAGAPRAVLLPGIPR